MSYDDTIKEIDRNTRRAITQIILVNSVAIAIIVVQMVLTVFCSLLDD